MSQNFKYFTQREIFRPIKEFRILKKIVSEIELFFSNKENFLLVCIKEDLVRNYIFQF